MDRRARAGHARDRHGLRRGLRLGRARPRRRERGRRGRQPGGLRARAAALPPRRTCASRASSSRRSPSPPTRSCSCRRSSTCRTPARCSSTSARSSGDARDGVRLDPQRAHARAEGRIALGQPLARPRVPRRRSSKQLCRGQLRRGARCSGCSTRASCARTSSRCASGWDAVHPRLGLTERFYDRFTPGDRRLGLRAARAPGRPIWIARWTSSRCAGREAPAPIAAPWRSSCTRTCPTSRASAPGRSARSGCGRRWPAATCRCSSCSTQRRRR